MNQAFKKKLAFSLLSLAAMALAPKLGAAQTSGASATAQTIRVGPQRPIKSVAEAAKLAKDGDSIEVDGGDYPGDVAVWSQNNLRVRAVGGVARMIANGVAAEGKAIWVVRAENFRVEGFEFSGATVSDRNGAGIRLEKGSLFVRNCVFRSNENGILTSNNPHAVLEIENSEFGHNGFGDGLSHNLYVGAIARLVVSGSYFHHANVGHLLKSRAAFNRIVYSRLTDEPGGRASYELDLPNGGLAYVIGNIIQQGPQTENPHLISYGSEGYTWPKNELYLINNTLVDKRPRGGVFLRVKPGEVNVKAVNNLLAGRSRLEVAVSGDFRNNIVVVTEEFADAARDDYRLKRNSQLRGSAVDAGLANEQPLMPDTEYRHPRKTARTAGPARTPGALQTSN